MRKAVGIFLFTALFFLAITMVKAQTVHIKKQDCQPSIEEIKSLVKSSFDVLPAENTSSAIGKVMIAGELPAGALFFSIREDRKLTLAVAIAMMGGIKKTAVRPVYLIRHSAGSETESIREFDYKKIQQGIIKDIELENGDVVFVSRGCADSKLLPPTPRKSQTGDFPASTTPPRILY